MDKIVIIIDDKLYEVTKGKSKTVKIKSFKLEDTINNIYPDIPCLYADTVEKYCKIVIYDSDTNDKTIEESGKNLFDDSYYVKISKEGNKKIAFFMVKRTADTFFRSYAFNNIIPLDVILYRMKAEYSGIVTESLQYIGKFKDIESLSNRSNFSEGYDLDSLINIFEKHENTRNSIKKLITDKNIEKGILESLNIEQINYNQLVKLIETEPNLVINDTVSDNFHAKVYKKILIALSIIMVPLSLYFSYEYIINKTAKNYYEQSITTYNTSLNQLNKKIKQIKKQLIYQEYQPFNIDLFDKYVSELSLIDGIIDLNIEVKKGRIYYELTIKGISNLEKARKKFKKFDSIKKKKNNIFIVSFSKEFK